MIYEQVIDKMAKALYKLPVHFVKSPWDETTPETKDSFRETAKAALKALQEDYGLIELDKEQEVFVSDEFKKSPYVPEFKALVGDDE